MFCIYCGRSLQEGEVCNCRDTQSGTTDNRVTDTQPAFTQPVYNQPPYSQPPYSQPPYSQPVYGQPVYGQPVYVQPAYSQPPKQTVNQFEHDEYSKAVASVIKAPVTVFFALLLTFAFAAKLIGALEFDLVLLLGMIGAWSVHSHTHTYSARPKSSGFKVLSTAELITIILNCIIFAGVITLLIISIISGTINEPVTALYRFFNGNIAGYSVSLTPLAIVSLYIIVGAVFGFNMFYHISLRNNLLIIRKRLSQSTVYKHYSNFPNIIMILHGILEFGLFALILLTKSTLMSYLNSEFGLSHELSLSVISIGINFGIPASLLFLGAARIIAGTTLCRLGCKFKKISK